MVSYWFIYQFRINEFGLDLVVDKAKDESSTNTPNSSRRNSDDKTPGKCGNNTNFILMCAKVIEIYSSSTFKTSIPFVILDDG